MSEFAVETSYEPFSREPEYVEANRAFVRSVGFGGRRALLDIACGTGTITDLVLEEYPEMAITGIDISRESLLLAQQHFADRAAGPRLVEGSAATLPFHDGRFDGAIMGNAIHNLPDTAGLLREIRRVLRPGAPVLIRQGFPDRYEPSGKLKQNRIELVRWFPEAGRVAATFPSLDDTRAAFAAAGFREEALEQVRETYAGTLVDLLGEVDGFRAADTTMRGLTDEDFRRGKERLRRAVEAGDPAPRSNVLDLLVLR